MGFGGHSRAVAVIFGLLAALLLAPAAGARAPVIAYVDPGTDKLALFDVETGSSLPAPDITVPGPVRRYAVSHDGRYVLYADEGKLHLLDRGSGAEVTLPGVDKYANPGGLTVSNTGLIAFDDNGNGPALVYDSATGSFVDVGFPPESKHRQTRLSGDGRYLATTCNDEEDCEDNLGPDSSLFLQDVATQVEVPIPDDLSGNDERDEEHPCIDGDGSIVGVDIPSPTKRDLYLYEPGSESSVFPPGRNDDEEDDVQCALDSSGTYVAWQVQTSEDVFFELLDRSSGQLVDLPAPERFTLNPVWLTDPYPPAVPISGQGRDRTAPRFLGRVRVTNGRFRAARTSARRSPVGTAFIYRLSEKATVRITIERRLRGRRAGRRCLKPTARNRSGRRCARWRRRGQITASATAGRNSTRFSGRVRKRRLRPGRYRARLIATDPAGNSSSERRVSFTIVRR